MKYILNGVQTERLNFRLLMASDYDEWLPFFHNAQAIEFVGLDKDKTPEELCAYWLAKGQKRYDEDTGGMNVLIDKITGHMIGQSGLLIQQVEGEELTEIGYSLLPNHWGKGYATEAARKLKEWAFKNTSRNQLISIIHTANAASARVAQKNGMKLWKHVPNYQDLSVDVYRITRDEWSTT